MNHLHGPEPSETQWKITRSFPRFALEEPVAAMLSASAPIPVSAGKMRDISLGGLAAMLDAPVAVGQRLWLEFRLPGAEAPIRILSKVRHDFGQRFGFQFLNITPEQRESIRKCCETLPNI